MNTIQRASNTDPYTDIDPRDPLGMKNHGGIAAAGAIAVSTEAVSTQIHLRIITKCGERNDVADTCAIHELPLLRAKLALAGGKVVIIDGWLDARHKAFTKHDIDSQYLEKEINRLDELYNHLRRGEETYSFLDDIYGNWRNMIDKMHEFAERWDGVSDSAAYWESLIKQVLPNLAMPSLMGDRLDVDLSGIEPPTVGAKSAHQAIDATKTQGGADDYAPVSDPDRGKMVTEQEIENFLGADYQPAGGTTGLEPDDADDVVVGFEPEPSDDWNEDLVEALTQHDGDQPPMHEQDAITVAQYVCKYPLSEVPKKVLHGLHDPLLTPEQVANLQTRIDKFESSVTPSDDDEFPYSGKVDG